MTRLRQPRRPEGTKATLSPAIFFSLPPSPRILPYPPLILHPKHTFCSNNETKPFTLPILPLPSWGSIHSDKSASHSNIYLSSSDPPIVDDSECLHAVTDPVDTAYSQNGRTEETSWGEIALVPLYLGMAATRINDKAVDIGVTIHEGLHTKDYCTKEFTLTDGENMPDPIKENTIHTIVGYSISHRAKFAGAGVTLGLQEISLRFCAYIWRKLDIVSIVPKTQTTPLGTHLEGDTPIDVDEQADSAARECVRCFGRDRNLALAIGFRNKVMPDAEGAIRLVEDLQEYKETVLESTWKTVLASAYGLRGFKDGQTKGDPGSATIKIAFFSATPLGAGVAFMKHALGRFCSELGVDMSWYIPEPKSEAFTITKTNHNILQGVADPEAGFDGERQDILHVVIIDDPKMPALIPSIKKARPKVKIIYHSHIEVCKDLVAIPRSLQRQVWECIWKHVRIPGVSISHPVPTCVPYGVPLGMVGLMPACTHWNHLLYPARKYITQIARFDQSNGIPDNIESYRKCCGHGAIDDPDAEITVKICSNCKRCDRRENWAKRSKAKIVVQLSLREGFKVKVSEALHRGKLAVTTRAGGIPFQIEEGTSGFLLEVGDTDSIANRLFDLYTNDDLYARMSNYAKASLIPNPQVPSIDISVKLDLITFVTDISASLTPTMYEITVAKASAFRQPEQTPQSYSRGLGLLTILIPHSIYDSNGHNSRSVNHVRTSVRKPSKITRFKQDYSIVNSSTFLTRTHQENLIKRYTISSLPVLSYGKWLSPPM
ncbi:hypothetical protein HOY80DRAFT_1114646 [Tuber brumale]|nr:hypothetical protein HOY80DRAFT_1114646 [Tuber brumale]